MPWKHTRFVLGTPLNSILLLLTLSCPYLEDHMILSVLSIVKLLDWGAPLGKHVRTIESFEFGELGEPCPDG